jgi:hypothetical protein
MNLTLTLANLLAAFEKYNVAIWPMQVLGYALGLVALFFAIKRSSYSSRIVTAILCFLWLWTGIVFFPLFFAPVYTPAYAFGLLFIIQGVLFLLGVLKPRLFFGFKGDVYAIVGLLFIAYAMLGYPAFGYFLGHVYPRTPPFGLTPCPTTIFTFGLLLLTEKRVPVLSLIIPLLWALSAPMPVSVGILEDIGLLISGVLGTAMIVYRDRKKHD